jgi:hypothetical protein
MTRISAPAMSNLAAAVAWAGLLAQAQRDVDHVPPRPRTPPSIRETMDTTVDLAHVYGLRAKLGDVGRAFGMLTAYADWCDRLDQRAKARGAK